LWHPGSVRTLALVRRNSTASILGIALVAAAVTTPAGQAFTGPAIQPPAELRGAPVLVELRRVDATALSVLRRANARLISSQIALWRLPRETSPAAVRLLVRTGSVVGVEREQYADAAAAPVFDDPLYGTEWWRAAVGAEASTPPGPESPSPSSTAAST
jgi:hypothetical protein